MTPELAQLGGKRANEEEELEALGALREELDSSR